MKRKILYVTGTRADYELMKSTLKAIKKDKSLKLQLVVTGMHLLSWYGRTVDEVKKEFDAELIINAQQSGLLLPKLNSAIAKLNPDIILVEGDRLEALITATAGVMNNIPVFHLSGGDISGNRDDSFRHAITKLANIHLPGTKKSAERIRLMGEEPWRIMLVGHMMNKELVSKKELDKFMGFNVDKNTAIVLQHPVTGEVNKAEEQMLATMEAITNIAYDNNYHTVVIYPNDDPGNFEITKVIELYNTSPVIHIFNNIPGKVFSTLMKYSGVLVGNSSAGITEAPHWGLPVVNIGSRQNGREQAGNVWNVPHSTNRIMRAIRYSKLFKSSARNNPYRTENVEKNIIKILKTTKLDKKLLQKRMTY